MLIFSFLSLLTFGIPTADVADRLSISLTLLLTSVAFKYAVASLMPPVHYQTLLDGYVLANSGVMVLVTLSASAVAIVTRRRLASQAQVAPDPLATQTGMAYTAVDEALAYMFCALWVLVQLRYALGLAHRMGVDVWHELRSALCLQAADSFERLAPAAQFHSFARGN